MFLKIKLFWKIMFDKCFILQTFTVRITFRVKVTVGVGVRVRIGALGQVI